MPKQAIIYWVQDMDKYGRYLQTFSVYKQEASGERYLIAGQLAKSEAEQMIKELKK